MNLHEIINYLDMSAASYRDIQPYSPNLTVMIDDSQSEIQCFIRRDGSDKTILHITFRGTDSPKGWRTNLTFWKKTIPYDNTDTDIRVHSGFIDAYKSPGVRDRLLQAVADGAKYIKITGHSQGAAIAVLCAVDIQYNFPGCDIEAVLFGCPRVGNKAFMLSYNKRVNKTIRVENGNDVVTKLPFAIMGYRHVGARLHIGKRSLPFILSANDHYPHRYYSALIGKLTL